MFGWNSPSWRWLPILAAAAVMGGSPARAQSGYQTIHGTQVYTVVDQSRGIATFSNDCGSQQLTQGQLQNGAYPDQIIPCPRPGGNSGASRPNSAADRAREAENRRREACNRNSRDAVAANRRGIALSEQGNPRAALAAFEQAERLLGPCKSQETANLNAVMMNQTSARLRLKDQEEKEATRSRYQASDRLPGNIYDAANPFGSPAAPPAARKPRTLREKFLAELRARLEHARKIEAEQRAFLTDIAVLVTMAERLKPDDPARSAIIASLREQLKTHDVDVDGHFRQLDRARGVGNRRGDPFVENQDRIEREEAAARAKAAAARPKLTPKDEEYCRLFANRALRGDLTPALANSPGGTFQTRCRVVVQDAVEAEAALHNDAIQSAGTAGAGVRTLQELQLFKD